MKIMYSAVCDIGKCRQENQDSIFVKTGENWGVFVAADGMGGHSDGARASNEITQVFEKWLQDDRVDFSKCSLSFLFSELRRLVGEANRKIILETKEGELCGSTVVVLIIVDKCYVLLSVGDSRCYEVKGHFYRQELVQMTDDEVCESQDNQHGKLTNAVGIREPLRCKIVSGKWRRKHIFLICTDGVYKFCNEKDLLAVIRKRKAAAPEMAGEDIRDLIYQKDAKDNLSAIVVFVSE